jgi:hypothetical protein
MRIKNMVEITNAASATGDWKGTRATLTQFGRVLKPFRCDGRVMRVGETISPEQVAALRRDNRVALIENRFLELHTLSAELTPARGT